MKITFLGTRGNIESRTKRHRMHSALLVVYRGRKVMVDAGEDWRLRLDDVYPGAIVITHAHPDHASGLKEGAPCPVFATEAAWEGMQGYPIEKRRTIPLRVPLDIRGITFEAFPVDHSPLAPAVGYRITAGRVSIFYVPDVVYIPDRTDALGGISIYVGDGATITRSMVRRRGDVLFGHTPIRTQLTWCQKEEVPLAVFTHCGSEIVNGDERALASKVRELGRERGVEARIACDGMDLVLR